MNRKLMLLTIIMVVFSLTIAGCATNSGGNAPVGHGEAVDLRPVDMMDVGRLSVDNPEAEIGAPVPANLPTIVPQFAEPDSAFDIPAPGE
jgi:hypothetical protein